MSQFCVARSRACQFQGRQQVRAAAAIAMTLAALALASGGAQAADQIVIDDFAAATTSSAYKTDSLGDKYTLYDVTGAQANGYLAHEVQTGAMGGTRTMECYVEGSPNSMSLALTVGYLAQAGANVLNVATNNVAGSAGVLTLNYSILSGVNLAAGGMNQDMLIQMPANDSPGFDIAVTLQSGGTSGPTAYFDKIAPAFTTPTDVALPLSSFTPKTGTGFNMTDVTGVQVVFNGQSQLSNVDFRVQAITVVVPEPSSVILLGIGSVGLLALVRRRRKA